MKRISDMVRRVKTAARPEAATPRTARSAESGKTLLVGPHAHERQLAAEKMASEAGAALYRVDLHRVVDKYVGETEKNLDRVFRLAERTGATLILDEADALFAKRTHVVDRLDRHASLNTEELLRRLGEHSGRLILTAADEKALDDALIRLLDKTVRLPATDRTPEPELVPVTWTATPEAVARYAELTDDFNPIHLDPAFAAGTPFGHPIAQGTLTLNLVWQSLRETFGAAALPGMEIDIRFAAPVRVGETLTATGRPRGNDATSYDVSVTTAGGVVVLSGTAITVHAAQATAEKAMRP